jgi:hypothetical protein
MPRIRELIHPKRDIVVPGVGLAVLVDVSSPFDFTKSLIPRCSGPPGLPGLAGFNPKAARKIFDHECQLSAPCRPANRGGEPKSVIDSERRRLQCLRLAIYGAAENKPDRIVAAKNNGAESM